jgi:hypothetical protein
VLLFGHSTIPRTKLISDNRQILKLANIILVMEKICQIVNHGEKIRQFFSWLLLAREILIKILLFGYI